MSCSPCGDNCCGIPFKKATKICAALDIGFCIIIFASSLTLLMAWESVVANFDWLKHLFKIMAETKGGADDKKFEEAKKSFEALDRKVVLWVVRGFLISFVVVHVIQAALGVGLFIAAQHKHKLFCSIWIGLTIPLLPFFVLRVVEVLIVFSFVYEIDQEEKAASKSQSPTPEPVSRDVLSVNQPNQPVKHQLDPSSVSPPPPTSKPSTPSLYPPPPTYNFPDTAPRYNGFASAGFSTNVHSTNNK